MHKIVVIVIIFIILIFNVFSSTGQYYNTQNNVNNDTIIALDCIYFSKLINRQSNRSCELTIYCDSINKIINNDNKLMMRYYLPFIKYKHMILSDTNFNKLAISLTNLNIKNIDLTKCTIPNTVLIVTIRFHNNLVTYNLNLDS